MGPLYFFPNQCIRQTSWSHPHKTSPVIAVVDRDNVVTTGMYSYWKALTRKIIAEATIALAPNYQLQYFSSQEELFDYVSSPDYMMTRQKKGICFGFEVVERASNDFQLKLFGSDHNFIGALFANMIPNQQLPVYNPSVMAPDMHGFENYSRRGFAYLHNVMANQVLKTVTGDEEATIALMTAPVPGAVGVSDDY